MISRKAFDAYSRASGALVDSATSRVERSLRLWIGMHPDATAAEARQYSIELIDGMAQAYSGSASTLAARFYDEQAAASGMELEDAVTEISYDAQWSSEKMHWAAGLYGKGNAEGFVNAAAGVMANSVRRSLNDTIMVNAKRDKEAGARFARVPTGHETCAFCFMLATRGAVYHTRANAGEMGQYHPHCDCKIVPGFGGDHKFDELVEGWRPKEALARLSEIERETGCKVNGKNWKANETVTESMLLRDEDWLYYGKTPKIEYADDSVRVKKSQNRTEREQHALECRTAEKLNRLGFKTVFQNDEIINDAGKVVGLPDLANGIEIKTVYAATSENSISRHISRACHKRGVSAIVIDVSENPNLTDGKARGFVESSLRRHGKSSAYLLKHDGALELIKVSK